MTRTVSSVLFLGGLLFSIVGRCAEDVRKLPVGQRQLFLDDHLIQRVDGLRSTMQLAASPSCGFVAQDAGSPNNPSRTRCFKSHRILTEELGA